ncbi:hypothetical protein PHJA_001537100 [Phtheirospermum japonicum]|uniref:Uncharacterized protein n=1 Tax=Phtheirospermum japonicum TaxID=374723 RepID=A0A830CA76_9LAMI|nr:hypothetical protein PHJA_001537100 [Phtheirospermum japonicum]
MEQAPNSTKEVDRLRVSRSTASPKISKLTGLQSIWGGQSIDWLGCSGSFSRFALIVHRLSLLVHAVFSCFAHSNLSRVGCSERARDRLVILRPKIRKRVKIDAEGEVGMDDGENVSFLRGGAWMRRGMMSDGSRPCDGEGKRPHFLGGAILLRVERIIFRSSDLTHGSDELLCEVASSYDTVLDGEPRTTSSTSYCFSPLSHKKYTPNPLLLGSHSSQNCPQNWFRFVHRSGSVDLMEWYSRTVTEDLSVSNDEEMFDRLPSPNSWPSWGKLAGTFNSQSVYPDEHSDIQLDNDLSVFDEADDIFFHSLFEVGTPTIDEDMRSTDFTQISSMDDIEECSNSFENISRFSQAKEPEREIRISEEHFNVPEEDMLEEASVLLDLQRSTLQVPGPHLIDTLESESEAEISDNNAIDRTVATLLFNTLKCCNLDTETPTTELDSISICAVAGGDVEVPTFGLTNQVTPSKEIWALESVW